MIILSREKVTGDPEISFPEPPRYGVTLQLILTESSRQAVLIEKHAQSVGRQISNFCQGRGKEGNK